MLSNPPFDLRALSVFVEVVQTRNTTTAAQNLGMSQSSVSQILSNLEKALDTQLLDRSVRPLHVTASGQFLHNRAVKLLNDANMTSRYLLKTDMKILEHVNVAIVDSMINAIGEPLIAALEKHTQGWSLFTGQSHNHSSMLRARQVDLAISDDPVEDRSDVKRFQILEEPFVLAVPENCEDNLDFRNILKQHRFIRYSSNSIIAQHIERFLCLMELNPAMTIQLDNTHAIANAIESGLGCAITTPLCLYRSGLVTRKIKMLPLPRDFTRAITLVCRNNELGDLPKIITNECKTLLKHSYLPKLIDYDFINAKVSIDNN